MEALTHRAFYFLRHGETDWNARNLSQGAIDIPLNETGLAQARHAAGLLRGRGIRSIVASSLSRAHDTARIVAEAVGLPVVTDDGLREVSFGVQEGQEMGPWFEHWIAGHHTPEGGESFAALRARGTAAVNRALAHEAPVLVVAHGALFRTIRAAMGLSPEIRTPNAQPYFCEPGAPSGTPWTLTPI